MSCLNSSHLLTILGIFACDMKDQRVPCKALKSCHTCVINITCINESCKHVFLISISFSFSTYVDWILLVYFFQRNSSLAGNKKAMSIVLPNINGAMKLSRSTDEDGVVCVLPSHLNAHGDCKNAYSLFGRNYAQGAGCSAGPFMTTADDKDAREQRLQSQIRSTELKTTNMKFSCNKDLCENIIL